MLADQQNISERPSYLPDQMNTEADALSLSMEAEEWMLAPGVARKIFTIYGSPICIREKQTIFEFFSAIIELVREVVNSNMQSKFGKET